MPQDPLIGKTLGDRYRLRRLIGVGSIGMVYVADHVRVPRRSAVKILRAEYLQDPGIVERFRREARAISRLDHRNIVRVEGFGLMDDGRLYLVMEYIKGPSLRSLLRQPEPIPLGRALAILRQLCDAVGFANRHDVIHRDLKPENLLLVPRRSRRQPDLVKVLDFGMAKIRGAADSRTVTREGEVFGTPAYMSPEQCYGGAADTCTDQYAVGIIGYELLARRLPFEASSSIEFMQQHAKSAPEPPGAHRDDVAIPDSLSGVILRALAKAPEDRWPSLEVFGQRLAEELERLSLGTLSRGEPGDPAEERVFARPSSEVEIEPMALVQEAARAVADAGLVDQPPALLARQGAVWLAERYGQVVRLIAEQMRRLDLVSPRITSLLADAVAADEALVRAETELAIYEAEAADLEARAEAEISTLHAEILEVVDRRVDARGSARRALDQRLHELEQHRADREAALRTELDRLDPILEAGLRRIAEGQEARQERHLALGDALNRRRRRGVDFELDGYFEMLDRLLAAQALGAPR